MSKETSAKPYKSYFPKVENGASSSAAAVSGTASKAKHRGFASNFKDKDGYKKQTSYPEFYDETLYKSSLSHEEIQNAFKKKPPSIAETVYEGAKSMWYAAGLPKTKEDELALKKKEAMAEMMKARRFPVTDFGPADFREAHRQMNIALNDINGGNGQAERMKARRSHPGMSDKEFESLPQNIKDALRKK